jgi:hypothetical protein
MKIDIEKILKVERKYPNPMTRVMVKEVLDHCDDLIVDLETFVYEINGDTLVDWNEFRIMVKRYVRILDDLVDEENNPDRNIKAVYHNPEYLLETVGINFDEGKRKYMDIVQKNFTSVVYAESFNLAKERGCYKSYDVHNDMNDSLMKKLIERYVNPLAESNVNGVFHVDDINDYGLYGRRNNKLVVMPDLDPDACYINEIKFWTC